MARHVEAGHGMAGQVKTRKNAVKEFMEQNIHKHPEWKRLFTEIAPAVEAGKAMFSYEELEALAGLPINTPKGRGQFQRFQRAALVNWSLWFENVFGKGYRVIKADEHVSSARRRSVRAKKLTAKALLIVTNTKLEDLTDEARKSTLMSQALLGAILHTMEDNNKALQKIAASIERPALGPSKECIAALVDNLKGGNA